jgi:hypothetical protein
MIQVRSSIMNGCTFTLDTRRKYDGYLYANGWGWDIKSTTATSQQAFEAACKRFDYDRARVFYAKGPKCTQDLIIGISKSAPHKLFKVFMKHGDELWKSGERKCAELCFKYWSYESTCCRKESSMNELVTLVAQMRNYQRQYFEARKNICMTLQQNFFRTARHMKTRLIRL